MKTTLPLIAGAIAAQAVMMTFGHGSWPLILGFIAGAVLSNLRRIEEKPKNTIDAR